MKNIIKVVVAVLLGFAVGWSVHVPSHELAVGAVGDVNQTPRMWQQQVDMSTTTEASIANPVGSDVLITSIDYYYTGLGTMNSNAGGVASFQILFGTSTDSYIPGPASSYLLNTTVATSTPLSYQASSTPGVTSQSSNAGTFARTWSGSSRLNLYATATSSGATGYIVIRYLKL